MEFILCSAAVHVHYKSRLLSPEDPRPLTATSADDDAQRGDANEEETLQQKSFQGWKHTLLCHFARLAEEKGHHCLEDPRWDVSLGASS